MNALDIQRVSNLSTDEDFTTTEVVDWINLAISDINTESPLTTYPIYSQDDTGNSITYETDHPLGDDWSRVLLVYYVSQMIKGNDSAIGEKQSFQQVFLDKVRKFKATAIIDEQYLSQETTAGDDLSDLTIGAGLYEEQTYNSPFAGDWQGYDTGGSDW